MFQNVKLSNEERLMRIFSFEKEVETLAMNETAHASAKFVQVMRWIWFHE